jgi:hypothetical protein
MMRGRNFLELNCGTMLEIVQLWLNDRYLSRGEDKVPRVTGIEHTGLIGNNNGMFRLTLEDAPLAAGVFQAAPVSPPTPHQPMIKATP